MLAGGIADNGMDPIPHMLVCKQIPPSRVRGTRELLSAYHVEQSTNEFLNRFDLLGKGVARDSVQLLPRSGNIRLQLRVAGIGFFPGEAFSLCHGNDAAVLDQRRWAVVVERGETRTRARGLRILCR